MTSPCRMIIKLCISMSEADSNRSRKVEIPAGSTPCASGELRGKSLLFMRSQRVVDQPGAAVGFAFPVSDPSNDVAEIQTVGRPGGFRVDLQSAASSSDQA